MRNNTEHDVAADSQAQRKNDPFCIIVTIGHTSWEAAGEASTASPIEDGSVTPLASWLTQCQLL